jgi:SET domain
MTTIKDDKRKTSSTKSAKAAVKLAKTSDTNTSSSTTQSGKTSANTSPSTTATTAASEPDSKGPPARNTRSRTNRPPKQKSPEEIQEELVETGKRRRVEEDGTWRRRDSVTHLVASIYADIEAAAEIQKRLNGTGEELTDEEHSAHETNEDIRLDYLREIRLAGMYFAGPTRVLQNAVLPRGKNADCLRAARDVVSKMNLIRRARLTHLVEQLGWSVVAICFHSENFRTRLIEVAGRTEFEDRVLRLRDCRSSIQFFARGRLFNWLEATADQVSQDVLFRDLRCINRKTAIPNNRKLTGEEAQHARLDVAATITGFPDNDAAINHPHEWTLSADGTTATRLEFVAEEGTEAEQTHLQTNIKESEVLTEGYTWKGKSTWLVRDEPRYRSRFDEACQACYDEGIGENDKWRTDCECGIEQLKSRREAEGAYFGCRVELCQISPEIGTGVRALLDIPAHSLLAEYVGEIYPIPDKKKGEGSRYGSGKYLYSHPRKDKRRKSVEAMYIDPAVRGNWTRFVNHSCMSKVQFEVVPCGNKTLTCIVVGDRPIEFGEEITVNYGRDYFTLQQIACRCREDKCTLWDADNPGPDKMFLSQAKKQGVAPAWAA